MATLKQLAKAYFLSAWIPSVVGLFVFTLFFINEWKVHIPLIGFILLIVFAVSLLGILISAVVQFIKGRKAGGVVNALALPVVVGIAFCGMGFLAVTAMFSEEPDNFGKDIVIPPDMKVSVPVEKLDDANELVSDELTENILAAFSSTNAASNGTAVVSTDFRVLEEFGTTNRQKLIQSLASSPRWFLTEERGKAYAYRRLAFEKRWDNSLNGFYSVAESSGSFQTRIIIGFDGPIFTEPFRRILTTSRVGAGDLLIRGRESYFVLQSQRASVEIFEQSERDARPATQLALADVKRELEAALAANSVPRATNQDAEIQLANGTQGGIYQVRAYVNPGEAGRAYIKVFEATRNTRLSVDRIKGKSMSRVGFSTNANEKFRYQSELTVYEGDWGNYYPGRFELWFIPDSGKPERKLIERIFRIEGWMR